MIKLLHEPMAFDPELGVRYRHIDYRGRQCPKHWHNYFECLLVTEGRLEFYLEGDVHQLNVGDFVIINPCEVHGSYSLDPFSKAYMLQFPESMFNAVQGKKVKRVRNAFIRAQDEFPPRFLHTISNAFLALERAQLESGIGYYLQMKSIIYSFLHCLIDHCVVDIISAGTARTDKHLVRLNKIMCYIESNYHLKITLEDCSQQIHVDSTYFSRFFKKYMGENFSRYLSVYRMNHAYNDLITTDLKITELSERNGFTNYKYFLSLFKELYGCTPLEVRHKMHKYEKFDAVTPKSKSGSFQQMYCY